MSGCLIGLEKESLRATGAGHIAQTPHPSALGSALTHPKITTDFSEALLELITAPFASSAQALEELRLLHLYVYQNIDDEMLWATSMPCLLFGEDSIPIAYYGESNAGKMKTIYRRGLTWRYGKIMQAIAGVHFNFSLPEDFWSLYHAAEGGQPDLRAFRDQGYFAMLRNLQRVGWLIPYLFGASPAVCESFLNGRPTTLSYLGQGTYYEPYATSLRMGDIGYQNKKEGMTGVKACYDSLESYTATLRQATETPCEVYQNIGIKVAGEYRQLNANRLQIENEYYSTVRPKALPRYLQKPAHALLEQGVRYVELRSIDVNAFEPLGVGETQMHFVEALMCYALLRESPLIDSDESRNIDDNLMLTAHNGRDPHLRLRRGNELILLRDWANEIMADMQGLCEYLDTNREAPVYSLALADQWEKVYQPDLTPSAQMLSIINDNRESFFQFALRTSRQYKEWFCSQKIPVEQQLMLDRLAQQSLQKLHDIEQQDQRNFDEFLADYMAQ